MLKKNLLVIVLLLLLPWTVIALDVQQTQRFEQIMGMKMVELTTESERLLATNHATVDWQKYKFPQYVENSASVRAAYRIAVIKPELLAGVATDPESPSLPCYCSCEAFGHKSLLDCFLQDGRLDSGFDEHGSQCNICYAQAMLAFLWQDAGATQQEILAGMKVKFARLLEKRKKK